MAKKGLQTMFSKAVCKTGGGSKKLGGKR